MQDEAETPWEDLTNFFKTTFGPDLDWASRADILRERIHLPKGDNGEDVDYFEHFAVRIWRTLRFELTGGFYNVDEARIKLKNLENALNETKNILHSLPNDVYFELEKLATMRLENCETSHLRYRFLREESDLHNFHDGLLRWVLFRPLSHFLNLLIDIVGPRKGYEKDGFEKLGEKIVEESLISQVLKNTAPIRDIQPSRSKNRIVKVEIIDELRFLWRVAKKKDAPRSISPAGSPFGDYIEHAFSILGIEADARAAVDAWNSEYKST